MSDIEHDMDPILAMHTHGAMPDAGIEEDEGQPGQQAGGTDIPGLSTVQKGQESTKGVP
jgi:hypothetical protein